MRLGSKRISAFLSLTFLLTFLLWYIVRAGNLSAFVPLLAAIVVQLLSRKEPIRKSLGISLKLNRWFLVAWLLPPAAALLSGTVSLLFTGVEFSFNTSRSLQMIGVTLSSKQASVFQSYGDHWLAVTIVFATLVTGITWFFFIAIGEEVGWRGFLLGQLRYMGFWKSSAVIGAIWVLWHLPPTLLRATYSTDPRPTVDVAMMAAFTMLASPIIAYVRLRAESVLAAAVMHGSFNSSMPLSVLMIKGGDALSVGLWGFAGFVVLIAINICIFLGDRYLGPVPSGDAPIEIRLEQP